MLCRFVYIVRLAAISEVVHFLCNFHQSQANIVSRRNYTEALSHWCVGVIYIGVCFPVCDAEGLDCLALRPILTMASMFPSFSEAFFCVYLVSDHSTCVVPVGLTCVRVCVYRCCSFLVRDFVVG